MQVASILVFLLTTAGALYGSITVNHDGTPWPPTMTASHDGTPWPPPPPPTEDQP